MTIQISDCSVRVVERLSDTSLLVTWSDARRGQYVDQTWILTIARKPAACALTGAPIRRDDHVFKPRCTQVHRPANHECRILASALTHLRFEAAA